MSCAQALDMISDLKLAHYMKINPKHMFLAQLLGTVIGCIVNYMVICVVLAPENGYRGFLDGSVTDPTGQWDGRKIHIFRSASIIWGAVGPEKFFSGSTSICTGASSLVLFYHLSPGYCISGFKRKCRMAIRALYSVVRWCQFCFMEPLHHLLRPRM